MKSEEVQGRVEEKLTHIGVVCQCGGALRHNSQQGAELRL